MQRPEAASAVCLDGEPLARFRIASADRPEDALAIQMSRSAVYRISSPDCDEAYRFRLNLASLAGMRIGFVSHGRPTRVDATRLGLSQHHLDREWSRARHHARSLYGDVNGSRGFGCS